MKLFIEKHPELARLIHLFSEIETQAHRLGIQLDELYQERTVPSANMHALIPKKNTAVSSLRKELFLNSAQTLVDNSKTSVSATKLSVHKKD